MSVEEEPSRDRVPNSSPCARNMSRIVRSYLEQNIFIHKDLDRLSLPSSCPIHPLNDVYHYQETNHSKSMIMQSTTYGFLTCCLGFPLENMNVVFVRNASRAYSTSIGIWITNIKISLFKVIILTVYKTSVLSLGVRLPMPTLIERALMGFRYAAIGHWTERRGGVETLWTGKAVKQSINVDLTFTYSFRCFPSPFERWNHYFRAEICDRIFCERGVVKVCLENNH